ncbi:hypothetical protein [Dactylosporangium sp. NPDC051541]|uniref:hypothetical protein n=1 Tax=Dactylosporangium sp. NPDC051541 TaxID=3363977 RepID=UPI0037BB185A
MAEVFVFLVDAAPQAVALAAAPAVMIVPLRMLLTWAKQGRGRPRRTIVAAELVANDRAAAVLAGAPAEVGGVVRGGRRHRDGRRGPFA